MSTFITRLDRGGAGPRVAIKDIIDVAGVPTTAGCRAVQRSAVAATRDSACLGGLTAAGARIVGKTNLQELALLPFGTNPWFGTPVNPLDPALLPGGSSSGSAVAVATGEADVALGSDTGGSVRIPAACCGVAGLKTTYGRISTEGVWPLAPSLDTIGPMARDVTGLLLGMTLLEPGFVAAPSAARVIGRLRTDAAPAIEAAVDAALRDAELEVVDIELPDWQRGVDTFTTIFFAEFWDADHHLLADRDGIGEDIAAGLELAEMFRPAVDAARVDAAAWRAEVHELFGRVELLALPTLTIPPPPLTAASDGDAMTLAVEMTRHTALFNVAHTPCLAVPIPVEASHLPASLQLVGPLRGEELLLATGARVEAAVRR